MNGHWDTPRASRKAAEQDKPKQVIRYLSRTEVAAYLGLKSANSLVGITLPPHDCQIGRCKGWKPTTIDVWNAARPGRGRWGPRRHPSAYKTHEQEQAS